MVRPPKSTSSLTYTFFALDIVLEGVVDLRVTLQATALKGAMLAITSKRSQNKEQGFMESIDYLGKAAK